MTRTLSGCNSIHVSFCPLQYVFFTANKSMIKMQIQLLFIDFPGKNTHFLQEILLPQFFYIIFIIIILVNNSCSKVMQVDIVKK